MKKIILSCLLTALSMYQVMGQRYTPQIDSSYAPLTYIKYVVGELCQKDMAGRGYVESGMQKAGHFLIREFQKQKTRPFMQGDYNQSFQVAANTIEKTRIRVDRQKLKPGFDYIIQPNSGSINGSYRLGLRGDPSRLPLVSLDQNLETSVTMDTSSHLLMTESATIYPEKAHIIFDAQHWPLLREAKKIKIDYENETKLHEIFNVGAMISGISDSTVFVTAHYDHLGKLGDAIFAGASDNASGTAMMMALSEYFSQRKPYYTLVLIAFAAEETGLLGSEYFTHNMNYRKLPIKMVINLDIMGNAEGGITVVNTEKELEFLEKLREINEKQKIQLPEVRQRGNTQNSDHYYFTEDNVPAVFIYSNGGQGYYHDVYDTPENLLYTNIDKVFYLLANYILHN